MVSFHVKLLLASHFICYTLSAPQQPEINDQFISTATEEPLQESAETTNATKEYTTTTEVTVVQTENKEMKEHRKFFENPVEVTNIKTKPTSSVLAVIYDVVTKPIARFISSPKVNYVLRNVGTCIVNGAMEIVAYYIPAPLIPLIASAAGMVIPFEPVVMLKEKMPVTSYRRAFRKAMNSFLNTFEGYKLDNYEDDPYMTRRFNRRFMKDVSEEKKKEI